jgi:hypothetical protein
MSYFVDLLSGLISGRNVSLSPQHLFESPLLGYLSYLPRLMTISATGINNLLLGAFYNLEVLSTLCDEWCTSVVKSWSTSTSHAAIVGYLRRRSLGRWRIGAGVTSLTSYAMISGECCMWHNDLALTVWIGSVGPSPHRHFCRVLKEDVRL